MKHASYRIVKEKLDYLLIEDVGPWDQHPTVTNDAEWVVEDLMRRGRLPPGRRVRYIDSEGNEDELLVRDGRFAGFGD